MFKANIELFKVHSSCKVKFSLVVRDDKEDPYNQLINKFNFSGNDYLKITPYPFITIDITSKMDKNEGWSNNRTFNLNRRELYNFIGRLNQLYSRFISHKELFYYDDYEQLHVNNELADKYKEYVICGNKTILLQACVVEIGDNHDLYEGIFMSINSMDYFTYLTYGDVGYLLYELKRIDMTNLTMQVINTVYLTEEMEKKQLAKKAPTLEIPHEEIIDKKPRIKIEDEAVIPDI